MTDKFEPTKDEAFEAKGSTEIRAIERGAGADFARGTLLGSGLAAERLENRLGWCTEDASG